MNKVTKDGEMILHPSSLSSRDFLDRVEGFSPDVPSQAELLSAGGDSCRSGILRIQLNPLPLEAGFWKPRLGLEALGESSRVGCGFVSWWQ